jgi:hypothetical protein
MKTYTKFSSVIEKEGNPFEGKEIAIFIESENGKTYEEIFAEYGFTARLFENEELANNEINKYK